MVEIPKNQTSSNTCLNFVQVIIFPYFFILMAKNKQHNIITSHPGFKASEAVNLQYLQLQKTRVLLVESCLLLITMGHKSKVASHTIKEL